MLKSLGGFEDVDGVAKVEVVTHKYLGFGLLKLIFELFDLEKTSITSQTVVLLLLLLLLDFALLNPFLDQIKKCFESGGFIALDRG